MNAPSHAEQLGHQRNVEHATEAFRRAHLAARQLGMSAYGYRVMGKEEPNIVAAQIRNEAQAILSRLEVDGCEESEAALDRLMVLALALAGER